MTELTTTEQKVNDKPRKLVPRRMLIKEGPTRFNWEMARLGQQVALLMIEAEQNNTSRRYLNLRVVGTLQVNPLHMGVMFWGWARGIERDKNELLDDRTMQKLIAERESGIDAVEFVCGIYYPNLSSERGWIAPCDPTLPHLLDTFKEAWNEKD